jgi:hypothetical protein
MIKILSLSFLVAGVWLIAMGYQRQHSLAGHADDAFSRIGTADRATPQTVFYAAGALFTLGGIIGLRIVRK